MPSAEKYAALKAAGLCPQCGRNTPELGRLTCWDCIQYHNRYDGARYAAFRSQFNRDAETLLTLTGAERRALWEKMRADVDAFGCWKYETDALLNELEQEAL